MLKSYLKEISKTAKQGDAREESYYATLAVLLKEAAQSFDKGKIHITTLPKSTEAGEGSRLCLEDGRAGSRPKFP